MTEGQARIVAALASKGYIGVAAYRGAKQGWCVHYAASLALALAQAGERIERPTQGATLKAIAALPSVRAR